MTIEAARLRASRAELLHRGAKPDRRVEDITVNHGGLSSMFGTGPVFGLRKRKIRMTTAKQADRRAAEKNSGQGGVSNADGTATGPGSSAASRSKQDNQHSIKGAGSAKANASRPGHKTS
jgi:hypothetical protein